MGVSGDIFSGTPSIVTIMYKITFVVCLSAVAALPLEDNAKFKVANAVFANVYKMVAAGDHINLRPVNSDVQAPQIANAYLADSMDVAKAKEAFMDTFRKVEAGGLKAMQVPGPKVAEHIQHMSATVAPVAVYSAYPYQHMANNNFATKHVTSKALNANFKATNEAFTNEYKSVAAGEHINRRPVNNDVQAPQIANAYLADSMNVLEAKEAFMDTFRKVKAAPKVAETVAPVAVYSTHPYQHMANSNFANKHVAPSSFAVASKTIDPADPKNAAKFKAANKAFTNKYKMVAAGDHISQRPVNTDVQAPQIANTYLADSVDVAEAKEAFMDTFRNVEAVQASAPKVAVSTIPKVTIPATYAHIPVAYAVPHTYAYGYPTYAHGIPYVMPSVQTETVEAVKMA